MNLERLRGRLLISLGLGVLVFVGLSAYGDFRDVLDSLGAFRWELLPAILALTSGNYVLRFFKWQFYLRQIGVRGLRWQDSFAIYFSGLGMVVTPGKVGEWLKSYLLREVHGTPFIRSAPILIAERLTDSVALLVIAAAGVIVFRDAWPLTILVAAGCVALVFAARHRPLAMGVIGISGRLPVVRRFSAQLSEFYESTYVVLEPWSVLAMTALSLVSWFFEVLAFFVTLLGMGVDASPSLLLKTAFILPIATLAGALFMTPGGLGVAEGGITGLTKSLIGLSKSEAAVGTLIVRFGTLWFGVIIGLGVLMVMIRRLSAQAAARGAAAVVEDSSGEGPAPVSLDTPRS